MCRGGLRLSVPHGAECAAGWWGGERKTRPGASERKSELPEATQEGRAEP